MTELPKIAARVPCEVQLEKGKKYFFCTCGLSASQPFCDGAHKGTGMKSMPFEAEQDGPQWLCQCKKTANAPFCDGTHKDC